jgi:FdhE protein
VAASRKVPRLVADPGEIGTAPAAAFLTLPDPAMLFKARARRLETLAEGNPFGDFLRFMATIAGAQDGAIAAARPLTALSAAGVAKAGPLLDRGLILAAGEWREILAALADRLAAAAMPGEAAGELRALAGKPAASAIEFAGRVLDRHITPEEAAEAVFVMAALQVAWTRRAAAVAPEAVFPRETVLCPLCGAAPVASLVGAAGERQALRFLVYSLCAAEWRYVRIKCTTCGSTEGIDYHSVAGHAAPAKAEACSACNAYSKIVYAETDPWAEPLADDLASLALDVLMSEGGWRRVHPNPFLVSATA